MIGFLPGLGGTLADLAGTGQLERVLRYDLELYARSFGGGLYFTYGTLPGEWTWTVNDVLVDVAPTIGLAGWQHRRPPTIATWLMPFVPEPTRLRRAMGQCQGLRVMNLTGVVPALLEQAVTGRPWTLHLGYDHVRVARVLGHRGRAVALLVLRRVACRRASAVIASNAWLADLARGLGARRVSMIPNGVDRERFVPVSDRARGRRVLYVGRRSPEKNLAALEQAVAMVPGAELVIVSGHPYAEMPGWYQSADVFVLPSLTEGSPKALFEAMASGLPCITSDVVVGVPGLLRTAPMPGALASLIRAVLDDPAWAHMLGEENRAITAHYDVHMLVAREIAATKEAFR